jgi:hypothetical protein
MSPDKLSAFSARVRELYEEHRLRLAQERLRYEAEIQQLAHEARSQTQLGERPAIQPESNGR